MISTLKEIFRPYKRKVISLYQTVFPEKPITYSKVSYSQEGEDMILAQIFECENNGFYVDVGAHHPQRFSNTYYFYLQGWRGINLDAMPGSMAIFNKMRARDINLEIAISDTRQKLTYYAFNEPALNGFCKHIAEEFSKAAQFEIILETEIQTFTLAEVLDTYLPTNQTIDFLNVDVEGLDYQVLKSNNWHKYRPRIVLVESLEASPINQQDKQLDSKIEFMQQQNYQLYCKTLNTLIFKDQQI